MEIFFQQIINGITLGCIYAIVALGYTMVYGVIQLINFAHGDIVMIGAMTAYTVISLLLVSFPGLHPVLIVFASLLVAMPVCMLVGWGIEKLAYRPLRHAPKLTPLITAIGMSIILQNLSLLIWGRDPLAYPETIAVSTLHFAGVAITTIEIFIIATTFVLLGIFVYFIYFTKMGVAMRATSENIAVANLMGINSNSVISMTFIIGSMLAAVGGVMIGVYYGIAQSAMGSVLGLKAFCAAVLGGIGNIAGAMIGGILLGIVEVLGAGYIGEITDLCRWPIVSGWLAETCADHGHYILFGSNYQDVFAFLVLILVLVFRPSGLLGERVGVRD